MTDKNEAIQKEENNTIDNLSITTVRTLAIDAIEKAKSGHPGMPMGSAPMGYQLLQNDDT